MNWDYSQQAKYYSAKDVLGIEERLKRMPYCMFSPSNQECHYHYEPCRSCSKEYQLQCENFIPINGHQQKNSRESYRRSADDSYIPIDFRNSDYVPMIIRNNHYVISRTKKVLDWIRRANDGGVR